MNSFPKVVIGITALALLASAALFVFHSPAEWSQQSDLVGRVESREDQKSSASSSVDSWQSITFGGYIFEYPETWKITLDAEGYSIWTSQELGHIWCPPRGVGFEEHELLFETSRMIGAAVSDYWELSYEGKPRLTIMLIDQEHRELGCTVALLAENPSYSSQVAREMFARIKKAN